MPKAQRSQRLNAKNSSSCGANFVKSKWSATYWQRPASTVCRQKREDVHTVYLLVMANQADFPTRTLCETLKVSTSGYYDWHNHSLSKRAKANATLLVRIRQAHQASDETYGMPRIRAELADADIRVSRKRIAHLMRNNQIRGVSRRRAWCVTTERNKRERPAPDLVNRKFVATGIN